MNKIKPVKPAPIPLWPFPCAETPLKAWDAKHVKAYEKDKPKEIIPDALF